MPFNTWAFAAFFAAVFILYHVSRGRLRTCLLLISLAPDALSLNLEPLWLDIPGILPASVLFSLDAAGSISLPGALPDLPASFDIYLQVLHADVTAPNGIYTVSNGLRLPLVDIL